MATIYARLINRYKFKYHILIPASFYKIIEEDQRSDEIELIINLKIINNLTKNDIDMIDVKSHLEHQIHVQETKDSGWVFDEINSTKIRFYKTGELNGSSYVEISLRSNVLNKKRNDDKYCFIRSILVSLHPCDNDHSKKVSNYKQQLDELNIQCFDFSNGFKCGDVHKFEKLNNLSIKIFELNFNQDKGKRKHNLIPTEIIKNDSDKVIDLKLNRNHYVLNKKINVP